MSDLISRSDLIHKIRGIVPGSQDVDFIIGLIENQPTAFDAEKVIEQLEEKTDFLKDCTKYGNKDAEQQEKSYSTMMMYEVADLVEDLIDIVKKGGVE